MTLRFLTVGSAMRRLVRSLSSAAVTFTIGVLVATGWSHVFVRRVSLCMLAHDPGAYDGKTIRVEALGSVISSPIFSEKSIIIFEPGCAESDAWASVGLNSSKKASNEVDEFVNCPRVEVRNAKVVVEGRFDQWASLGCFSPRFGIQSATVTLLSPVTSEPLPRIPAQNSR